MEQLLFADDSVIVYPWADAHARSYPSILTVADIPTSNATLRRYFARINPRPEGGFLYVTVRLGHSLPMNEIMEGLGWWFNAQKHGLWARSLQAEDTIVIGWLLNSLREIDLVALQSAIQAVHPDLEVGLRWRLISLGLSLIHI